MIVPEKTNNVRRVVIPSAVFKGGVLASAFLIVLAAVMVLDYANVMNQIAENKQLRGENRQLKQQVQVFKDKMVTIESTLDRVKTFATKLRIITNIEDRAGSSPVAPVQPQAPLVPTAPLLPSEPHDSQEGIDTSEHKTKSGSTLATLLATTTENAASMDPDISVFVQTEFEKLGKAYDIVSSQANSQEQQIQEIYERLSDKKSLLLSMPTQIPTDGYITSGFGIRFSPYGGRRKMHEGIDIANRYGADIVAPGDGIVIFAGIKPGYGKILTIDHGYGLQTFYGHSSGFFVAKGQRVHRGQRIAAVGSTGRSTGPHVHYEIHANGTPIDPMYYLLDR